MVISNYTQDRVTKGDDEAVIIQTQTDAVSDIEGYVRWLIGAYYPDINLDGKAVTISMLNKPKLKKRNCKIGTSDNGEYLTTDQEQLEAIEVYLQECGEGAEAVLNSVAESVIHMVNRLRGWNDVAKSGVHNTLFWSTGSLIGQVETTRNGYVFTKVHDNVREAWKRACKPNEDSFTVYKTATTNGQSKGRQTYLKLYCGCTINGPGHAKALKRSNYIMVSSGLRLTHAVCGNCHKRYEERV